MLGRPSPNRRPQETRTCSCGCGRIFECDDTDRKRYIAGHQTVLLIGRKNTEETRKRMSEARLKTGISKKLWQESSYVQKQMEARRVSQNKAEKLLEKKIDKASTGFRFVGDGKKIIGGRCPDFINEEKHLIIELFGDYWHTQEEVGPRIDHFERFGYRTLVIWERELKTPDLIEKIKKWVEVK